MGAKKTNSTLKRYALRLRQSKAQPVFLFSLKANEILRIADVSRISRDDAGALLGYQRPAVKRHVDDIVAYLEEDTVLFPNSIIIAFTGDVRFLPDVRGKQSEPGTPGLLEIPLPENGQAKPGWIVDGQQRVLALSQSSKQNLPVPVSAFLTDDVALQRDQFLRINNTKPLPRGLINELLPSLASPLPAKLQRKKIPSDLCDHLNDDPDSPFFGLIRRPSTPKQKRKQAVVTDTSLLLAIEESLNAPTGSLFCYHNLATGKADLDAIYRVLQVYWTAVRDTFPAAWGLPAQKSRLMHGVGIRSMGRLMDRVMRAIDPVQPNAAEQVSEELRPLRSLCRWTSGAWEGLGGMSWNELQNTPQHVRLLAAYLQEEYVRRMVTA